MKSLNSMRVNEEVVIGSQPVTRLQTTVIIYFLLGITQVYCRTANVKRKIRNKMKFKIQAKLQQIP